MLQVCACATHVACVNTQQSRFLRRSCTSSKQQNLCHVVLFVWLESGSKQWHNCILPSRVQDLRMMCGMCVCVDTCTNCLGVVFFSPDERSGCCSRFQGFLCQCTVFLAPLSGLVVLVCVHTKTHISCAYLSIDRSNLINTQKNQRPLRSYLEWSITDQ
jgi:hypothetical protein